ncbi:MAG: hypothetical protein KY466_14600 [Gemmatimonadetes bacterium]|nr:hypothetical protein [Gemmatimonadota bacterium]
MTRSLGPFAALLSFAILACDAVDFPPLVGPRTGPPSATIFVQYVHDDSLEGNLLVILDSWIPQDSTAEVTLDGQPVQGTQGPDLEWFFGESWTLGPGKLDGLPQVLGVPGFSDDVILVELPALVRDGSAVVCVADSDPLLPTSSIALPRGSGTSWRLQLTSSDAGLMIQGSGSPPEPLRLPRELLGSMAESWNAILHASVSTQPDFGDSPATLSAVLMVEWTLVGSGSSCPASS